MKTVRAEQQNKQKKKTTNPPAKTRRRRGTHPLGALAAMVMNPWNGPLARGLITDDGLPSTVLVRRRSTLTVDLSQVPTLGAGVEFAVVMNGSRDPYLAYRIVDPSVTKPTYVGRSDQDIGVIPLGSYGRVVASGVRVSYLGTETNRGGCVYHFNYSRENSMVAALAAYTTWGSLLANLGGAITAARVGATGVIELIDSPEVSFCEIKTQPENLLDAGMPAPSDNVALMRLAFVGPKEGAILQFDISEVVEYFHLTHASFARPVTNVPNGETLQRALNSSLSAPGTNATDVSKPGFLERLASTLAGAAGVVNTAGILKESVMRLMATPAVSTTVEELPLLLGAA